MAPASDSGACISSLCLDGHLIGRENDESCDFIVHLFELNRFEPD